MQFQNNFDLDEFLAYLFPGSLFLGTILLSGCVSLSGIYSAAVIETSKSVAGTLFFLVFLSSSLICGHIFSIVSRFVWRPLLNWLAGGDPEEAIFYWGAAVVRPQPIWFLRYFLKPLDSFFTVELNTMIKEAFQVVYGKDLAATVPTDNANTASPDPTAIQLRPAVPRLVRSYFFSKNERAIAAREQVVRSRSICSNFTTPAFIFAAASLFGSESNWWWIVLSVSGVLLLIKQRDLDLPESKEIYLYFLAIVYNERQPKVVTHS